MSPRRSSRRAGRLCPVCKTPVRISSPEFPFCSERCRLIDLGKWASGVYRIPGPRVEFEDVEPDETGGSGSGE